MVVCPSPGNGTIRLGRRSVFAHHLSRLSSITRLLTGCNPARRKRLALPEAAGSAKNDWLWQIQIPELDQEIIEAKAGFKVG